jgi:hypothetical protein
VRHRRHRRRSASLLLWGTLLVIVLLGYLNENPVKLGHGQERAAGRPERSRAASDVLVVGWPTEIARTADNERFSEVDWSWAWVDLLAAEIGPVSTSTPEDLGSLDLGRYRYVVVSHSAMAHPQVSESVLAFEQFVNQGGVLVLERPQGSLREAFSADGRGGLRTPRSVTSVARVNESLEEALTAMPLFTRYVGSTAPLDGAETLLSMDGAPVIYRLRRSAGTAITVDFNLGLALVSLQQGRPSGPAFEVVPGQPQFGPTVADMVADPALLEAQMPYIDLLGAVMVGTAMAEAAPLVTYWPYPDGADGVVLLSHDVPSGGDRTSWLAEHEGEHGATATFFFSRGSAPDVDTMDVLREVGAEQSVLWERTDREEYRNRRLIGVAGLRPFFRIASLAEHVDTLSDAMGPGYQPRGVRSRDGGWTAGWAGAFQEMAALGLLYDSSYGLAPDMEEALPAFRHGTGRPYLVLDDNGLPFGIYEVPVVVPALVTPEQLERFEALLRASQRTLHQTLTVRLSADMFARNDPLARYDAWRWLLGVARERGHLLLDLGRYVDFAHERRLSDLTSEVVHTANPSGDEPRLRLRIRAVPQSSRLWLRVPREVGEWRWREVRVRRDGEERGEERVEVPEVRQVEQLGVAYVLVQLAQGEQHVEVTYR